MTIIATIGAAAFIAGMIYVNRATSPDGANLGMGLVGIGAVLVAVAAGLWWVG